MRYPPAKLDDFLNLCQDCKKVQHETLLDIIQHASDSVFGHKYGFENIHNYNDFAAAVPTQSWSDIEPDVDAMANGATNQLFNGKPDYFICTSGTSSAMKMMPESELGRLAKSLTFRLRFEAMRCFAPSVPAGKILPLVNNATEGYTAAGIPFGSASGVTRATAPKAIQDMVALPPEVMDLGYSDELDYVILRFAVEADVRAVMGNNAGRIEQLILQAEAKADKLIDDIENGTISCSGNNSTITALRKRCRPNPGRAEELRAAKQDTGRFLPAAYWPNLEVIACWLAGSVGRYMDMVRHLLEPDVTIFDLGYGATEGKFNIPLKPDCAAGPLTTYAGFYEFRALGEKSFLQAHELQHDKLYEMFVTNYSGLYRYAIGDIIRVSGFVGTTPQIVFEYKAGEILNICGEKVAAASLLPAISIATGSDLVHWCVIGDAENKRYIFYLEFKPQAEADKHATDYADKLENTLKEHTLIYPIFRKQNLINQLKVVIMKPGWQEALYTDLVNQGRSRTQIKLPLIYNKLPHPEYCLTEN